MNSAEKMTDKDRMIASMSYKQWKRYEEKKRNAEKNMKKKLLKIKDL